MDFSYLRYLGCLASGLEIFDVSLYNEINLTERSE